ncbi:polyprenyl synthetase family protein [Glycomyces xiaoerkulensis]|uniref:polyprenyl synthetase family protein n=1 Tax=Glycomyces xiaoerkulensis TaxID=2038139 RepID=UPI0018E421E6|nr:polyprenyl synthetase family protein [Glycomyces xiaoerkulensis]
MAVLTDEFTAEREAIDLGLRSAVDRLPAPASRVASYHFGWTDPEGAPIEGSSGKALRPLLTLLAAGAVASGDREAWRPAVPAAVAVELVHNFSLIHDDIIDRDTVRRHRATVWKVFGSTEALLVGDALHALAFEVLGEADPSRVAAGAGTLAATVRALIDGQLSDTRFERRERVGIAECTAMSEAKTASLMACATELGGLFGGGSAEQAAALRDFGFRLGLAFQHVDDLLGIWGDPEVTGKPAFSDLRLRKKSLPVTAALGSGRPEAAELTRLYAGTGPLDDAQVHRAAELVEACGGRRSSRESADVLTASAAARLESADLSAEAVAALHGLAATTVGRAC